jgi:tRNA 2-thiouridine synthesizing protein B
MLHTVNHSPFRSDSLTTVLRYLLPGDVLLLIEDGVYGAQEGTNFSDKIKQVIGNNDVCVLEPDLQARGISNTIDGVKKVDYDGFVELTEQHQVTSWL